MGIAAGSLINLASRVGAVAGVLALTTLAARQGPDVQGAFALFTSVEGLMVALASGFGLALARRVSHHGEAPVALMSAIALACVALGILASLGLGMLWAFGPPSYASVAWLALAAPLLLIAPNLTGWWLGEGRMGPMALVTLAAPWGALACVAVLSGLGFGGLEPVLAGWVIAKVMVALALLGVLWRSGRLAPPRFEALGPLLPFIAAIGLTNLVSLANYRVGLFVVERELGLAATGIYSIAVIVAELLWFVSSAVTQAAYARIGQPDRHTAVAVTVRVLQLSLLALALAALPLLGVAWVALPALLGPDYAGSLLPLALLLPGVLLFGGASSMSAYFTHHAGQPQVPARVAGLSLLLHGALAWVGVPLLGVAGAALAATTAFVVAVMVLARRFAREAGLPLRALWTPGPELAGDLRALASRAMGRARR